MTLLGSHCPHDFGSCSQCVPVDVQFPRPQLAGAEWVHERTDDIAGCRCVVNARCIAPSTAI
eukprot:15470008-Alexandrium_andersonii.AAC.1